MQLRKLKCPNCGGTLGINLNDNESVFCPYCGEKFFVEGSKKEYTINQNVSIKKDTSYTRHDINEAAVIRARTEERESKNAWKIVVVVMGLLLLWIWFCFYMEGSDDRAAQWAIDAGKISAGASEDYVGEPYEAVVEQLKTLGFENVACVDLDDSGVLFWKAEKVESVSIGGNTTFYKSDYFLPTEIVIVKYH